MKSPLLYMGTKKCNRACSYIITLVIYTLFNLTFLWLRKKNEYVCKRTHFLKLTVTNIVMCVSHEQIIVWKVRVQDNICKWVGNGTKGQNKYGF